MRTKRFTNQELVEQHNSFKQLRRWRKERVRKLKLKDYSFRVPNMEPDIPYLNANDTEPSITWIGHSTFLIQLGGLNIVTDPVWAEQMAFQKRLSPPGIPISACPPVDVVLVSHSHYDHLSIGSIRKLQGEKLLLVPEGLKGKLRLKGFSNVRELGWWQSYEWNGVKFTFVPAQHWTRRTPWDMNSSHWGGWMMECVDAAPKEPTTGEAAQGAERGGADDAAGSPELFTASPGLPQAEPPPVSSVLPQSELSASSGPRDATFGACGRTVGSHSPTVYFAGDSGYFPGFKEIGKRFAIDVALMPIGAYEPEWFMGPQHVTPEEALQAFEDVGAQWFVPMHYGSFKLADDTPREALDRLEANRASRGIDEERIVLLPHGGTWRLSRS